jgi:hypothetical protein
VDTRARLKEERKRNRHGAFFGLGLGVGFGLGYFCSGLAPEGLTPYRASLVVAFGLGRGVRSSLLVAGRLPMEAITERVDQSILRVEVSFSEGAVR